MVVDRAVSCVPEIIIAIDEIRVAFVFHRAGRVLAGDKCYRAGGMAFALSGSDIWIWEWQTPTYGERSILSLGPVGK